MKYPVPIISGPHFSNYLEKKFLTGESRRSQFEIARGRHTVCVSHPLLCPLSYLILNIHHHADHGGDGEDNDDDEKLKSLLEVGMLD